jgi:penicillin-binding protein 1A
VSRRERQKRRKRTNGGQVRRGLLIVAALLVVVIGAAGAAVASWILGVVHDTPDIHSLREQPAGQISTVYAADGTRLGFIAGDILRTPVKARQISNRVEQATVAIEDRRFYQHSGVDYLGVARAALKNVTADRTVQGGSTLTMQLVRNLYAPESRDEKTIERKIREAKLADQLEQEHSKAWILTTYLNNVPYGTAGGQEAIGIQAAARVFFDKPASRLSLAQAALLGGLPQAPSSYNPFRHPRAARERRSEVLRAMAASRYITTTQQLAADASPLGLKQNGYYTQRKEPFVFDYIRQQLTKLYGADVVRAGGLRVYTSIDLRLQDAARAAIARVLYEPADPPAAIVTTDVDNGHILAMASSVRYGDRSDGGTNYNYAAEAQRQPGSTFKAMVLMAALRDGIDPYTTHYVSRHLDEGWLPGYPDYAVSTFANTYAGNVTIEQGTLSSDNTVYAQLDADVGPEAVRRAAYDLGVASRLEAIPAEGLGGLRYGVTVLEMANAYATIADGGIRRQPTMILRVVHPDGHVDNIAADARRAAKRTFTAAQTGEARRVLQQNMLSGTGVAAYYGCPAGGKTGTTSDIKDAWFVGFTPRLATAVWMGYTTPTPMTVHGQSVQGGTFPAPIWNAYMSVAHGGYCGDDWPAAPPFDAQSFFGSYTASARATSSASRGRHGGRGSRNGGAAVGGAEAPGSLDGSVGTGPNGAYAHPPQGEPDIQPPPSTPPAPPPATPPPSRAPPSAPPARQPPATPPAGTGTGGDGGAAGTDGTDASGTPDPAGGDPTGGAGGGAAAPNG